MWTFTIRSGLKPNMFKNEDNPVAKPQPIQPPENDINLICTKYTRLYTIPNHLAHAAMKQTNAETS